MRLRGPFAGHPGAVAAVTITSDGERLVSGGVDGTVRTWGATTGEAELVLTGHADRVTCLAGGRDPRVVVSGSDDGTARIWDVGSGAEVLVLSGHRGHVLAVAVAPDGARIASAGADGRVCVWDASTGELVRSQSWDAMPIWALTFTPDGADLISAGDDGTIRSVDGMTGVPRLTLRPPTGIIRSIAVTPDGRQILAGGDAEVYSWDRTTSEQSFAASAHALPVQSLAVTPDGRRFVSAGADGTALMWDFARDGEVQFSLRSGGPFWSVAVAPDGSWLATAGADGTVCTWDAADGAARLRLTGHLGPVTAVAVTPDGRAVLTGGSDGTARVWNLQTGSELLTVGRPGRGVQSVAVAPDGDRFCTTALDRSVATWDRWTGELLGSFTVDDGPVWAVAVSADGDSVVGACDGGTVRVWHGPAGGAGSALLSHRGAARAVAAVGEAPMPHRATVVSGGDDGLVGVFPSARVEWWRGHVATVRAVAVAPDGSRAASAGDDGTVRLWDIEREDPVAVLRGHVGPVTAVILTSDGDQVISAGEDGTVRLWDHRAGESRLVLRGHTRPVRSIAVTPDGTTLVSAGSDGTIRVWSLRTGQQTAGTELVGTARPSMLADPVSDAPSSVDRLGVAPEVARMAAVVAASSTVPPLSIALLADWGGGKSSFMIQMRQEIDRLVGQSRNNNGDSAFLVNVRQVSFNAWHYSDDHVWTGMIGKIFGDLQASGPAAPDPDEARARRVELRRRLADNRADQQRLRGALRRMDDSASATGRFSAAGSPVGILRTYLATGAQWWRDAQRSRAALVLALAVVGVGAVVWWLTADRFAVVGQWLAALGSAAAVSAGAVAVKGYGLVRDHADGLRADLRSRLEQRQGQEQDLGEQLAQVDAIDALSRFVATHADGAGLARHQGIVGEVHGHLEQLDRLIRRAGAQWDGDRHGEPPVQRVVLYVDDLDRCPPARVVDVLAAVHLLLALPLFVVVVGVDARWLRRSLDVHDEALFGSSRAGSGADHDPMDYLDKIFQIPFALRAMDAVGARSYVLSLLPEPLGAVRMGDQPDAGTVAGSPPVRTPMDFRGGDQQSPADGAARNRPADGAARPDPADVRPADVRPADVRPADVRPAAADRRELRPASLQMHAHEREFLAEMGPLTTTPRAAKKLINLYRLIRIGVPPHELGAFAASRRSDPYRSAAVLLALVVGAPSVASTALAAVLDAGPDDPLLEVLAAAAAQHQASHGDGGTGRCPTCGTWSRLLDGLAAAADSAVGLPRPARPYQTWAAEVARFSFHTRPLWSGLSPREQAQVIGAWSGEDRSVTIAGPPGRP